VKQVSYEGEYIMKKVIIVGGGASGMIASIKAAERGYEVIIIEKNEKLGKKVFITGKGRCNVTTNKEIEEIIKNIKGNGRLRSDLFRCLKIENSPER
jgi:predicted flavoprotein YhiN